MNSCIYDRVFLVPSAKDSLGWARRGGNRAPETKSAKPKISIAWWLVPSVIVYLVVSAMVFG
jgi:predicted oxidoreductase